MKKIFILGAGGLAKDIFLLIEDIGGYSIEGFIDIEERSPITIKGRSINVYGEDYLYSLDYQPALAIAIGFPEIVRKLSTKFQGRYDFPNLIHPSVIGNFMDIKMGNGNILMTNSVFSTSISIGSFNIINVCCTIGHDTVIGDYNVVNPAVNISGGVVIGDTNLLGVNATILQYLKIGSNSIVGASGLVTKDVENNVLVMGVPAVKTKKLNNGR